ncbi:MAG: hypothetical protein ACQESP_09740 [Candidatus Muiribacteriota bacterium]
MKESLYIKNQIEKMKEKIIFLEKENIELKKENNNMKAKLNSQKGIFHKLSDFINGHTTFEFVFPKNTRETDKAEKEFIDKKEYVDTAILNENRENP